MLYEYIKSRMLNTPSQTISDGNTTLTYHEIVNKAELLGEKLYKGIHAILCESELNTAISLLACFYSNNVAVPLSIKYGNKHYQKILDSIKPNYVISDNNIEIINDGKDENTNHNTCVIMCSSGTTGEPKGIMLSEENIYYNLCAIEKYMPLCEKDYIFISRPIYHCAVMTAELLLGLIKGTKILLRNDIFNPQKMWKVIEDEKITVTCGTPTIFYYLSKYIINSKSKYNLKTIAISGECMTDVVAKEICRAMPSTEIFNVYGLTEASPRVSFLPSDMFEQFPTSVGIPLDNVEIRIDEDELLVKAPSVMQGYYLNVAKTNDVIDDGWLHTGDIAEIRDGLLYIKCRKDNMIIRAGMNIYPQDIENSLKQDGRIIDVMAYGVKNDKIGEKIVVEVVGDNLNTSEIFKICKERLPSFQYPDSIKIVEKLDKTITGKLVRRRV